MAAVVILLVIVLISLLITRVATAALMSTGMSRQFARFQARSAFTGVGYTTSESEEVVSHPVRRRVVMLLMILGNAGIASVIATLLIGFAGADTAAQVRRSIVLVFGIAAIWILAANRRAERLLRGLFARILRRSYGLQVHDYAGLLHVGSDYTVAEIQVQEDDWLADRTLARLRLRDEGVAVLGIERDGEYFGAPNGDSEVRPGDTLVVYGRIEALQSLDDRHRSAGGELSHVDQIVEHRERARRERAEQGGGGRGRQE